MVFTKSPRRSMLSGKLSLRWSLKLKKMMFDGPFLMRIAVRPLKTLIYACVVKSSFGHHAPVIFSKTKGRVDRVEGVWRVSEPPRICLQKALFTYYLCLIIFIGTWSNIKVWIRSKGVRSASVHPARKAAATKEVLELMPWCMKVAPWSFPYYHRHKRTCSNKSLLYCS